MVARRIDRYVLQEEVGSGGMAVVYKARDTVLDREVAIKVLHPHLAAREESRRRFSREARAVARLRHPSILEIYDFAGDEARESFIVTEFVRGRTLKAFGDEVGFFLPEIAVLIAAQLAEALAHAHAEGVVHRDLKPENVMVREDGVLKLMDFGIARMIGGDERMTMTGALVGSPLHMAPEIIEGRDAGAPADVFALGTILYWMVAGEMAFAGNNTTQTLRRILEGEFDDPRAANPACSDEIAALIARCLDRDPAARPAQMTDLRDELVGLLAPLGVERTEDALRAFLLDPPGYAAAAREALVDHLIAEGEEALARKRPARALALFNRVLALDEGNERVRGHLDRLRRRRTTQRRLRTIGAAAGLAGAIAAGAWGIQAGMAAPPPAPTEVPGDGAAADGAGPAGDRTGAGADASAADGPGADATGAGAPADGMAADAAGADGVGPDAAGADLGGVGADADDAAGGAALPGVRADGAPAGEGGAAAGATPPAPGSGAAAAGRNGGARSAAAEAGGRAAEAGRARPSLPSEGDSSARVSGRPAAGSEAQPAAGQEAAAAGTQKVQLRWVPQGARLYVDGQPVSTVAPAWSGELPAGAHTFALAHPDCCRPWEERVVLDGGDEPVRRSIALAPLESGWFEVDCDLPDAEVWFEGTFKGTVAQVNARGGVPVAFSKDDPGRDRYVKTVRFQVLPPRGTEGLAAAGGEVVVRAGQKARSPRIRLEALER